MYYIYIYTHIDCIASNRANAILMSGKAANI